ncbi:AAA family ATPase [Selenomonas sp. ND2010]|jgi:guanylate kinase|uniref:AAA family ATPase n=1 Tax=Selenomonas sp. ND2010 TaxID=1410618 RepID=UPI00051AD7AC|nr:AAA family ATPase [Selenomonas sp. ND2010]
MTNRIYALVGPHAAGKSTMASKLIAMGIHFIPTYTTYAFPERGRAGKKFAQLYRSVSREQFNQLDLVIQFTHKGDSYGIRKNDILDSLKDHQISVMILEVNGIKQLTKLIRKKLATIYLMADYMTLVDRMLNDGYTNDEIKYHLQYAENNKEFDSWKITDHVIKNTGEPDQALIQLLSIMGLTTVVPQKDFDAMIK